MSSTLFIAIEGLDGSGGTTQSRLLSNWFQNQDKPVLLTAEPSTGPVGLFIREALQAASPSSSIKDSVLPYLFAADRRDHLDREILPALQQGKIVVSDRYYHSSLAYQSLAVGFSTVASLNSMFRPPDLTFFLWLSPEISFERIQRRGLPVERFETLDHLRTVSDAYEDVLAYCKSRGEHVHKIDASLSIEEIHTAIKTKIKEYLETQSGADR